MKITNHLLEPDEAGKTSIVLSRKLNEPLNNGPEYLIIHYTAMDDAAGTIRSFSRPPAGSDNIAAHIVIDYDGAITQVVPFDLRANHTGSSTWDGVDWMNQHAIGIELVNPGYVQELDGSFGRIEDGKKVHFPQALQASRVIAGSHKHRFQAGAAMQHWFAYPDAQMQALQALTKLLFDTYHLKQVIGHDDISAARKSDPGPAFPWDAFKTAVFGATDNVGKIFTVNADDTNLRESPSKNALIRRALPKGYEVGLIRTEGQWSKVYLAHTAADVFDAAAKRSIKTIGWIYSPLLTVKPGQA